MTSWGLTVDCAAPARPAGFPVVDEAGRADHVVMADPESNEFCVV